MNIKEIRDENTWDKELEKIISDFKSGSDEPLDGDETSSLSSIILAKIDLHEGNITSQEYQQIVSEHREVKRNWQGIEDTPT